ncbi:hypothetical protein F2P44_32565 [Massilia sp. CCM 8695]|uniref:THIF-type NAD/FAD binding fold domain-containing protein n=2 Tax=Massilia frigida TaxID=2609281 RepID=A0ABX0NJD9_9BURK|nr:hypothetical protein [Massilia frigida]
MTPEERIDETLRRFLLQFFIPWGESKLDNDFQGEARTYWALHCKKSGSAGDAISEIYTFEPRPTVPRVFEASLVLPVRWLLAGTDREVSERLITSLGRRASQVLKTLVVQVPIEHDLTPLTWPRTREELELILNLRLSDKERQQCAPRSGVQATHRVLVLSSPNVDYGYMLSGGPATTDTARIGKTRTRSRSFPVRVTQPLSVSRLEPAWTYGRGQLAEIPTRQRLHMLVLGAGALGSHLVDQLARAGVGKISVVDPEIMEGANIGRHLLGAESLGLSKAKQVAQRVGSTNPACAVLHFHMTAQTWLQRYSDATIDMIMDLTGEPDVRYSVELHRVLKPTALLIGWMEPFVAAAHACQLPVDILWLDGKKDRMGDLQAVTWPHGVMLHEPACNSEFQAYTPAAAAHAVALIAESALELLDGKVVTPKVRSWVRGQRYLDVQYAGLALREWANEAGRFDGVMIERQWNE